MSRYTGDKASSLAPKPSFVNARCMAVFSVTAWLSLSTPPSSGSSRSAVHPMSHEEAAQPWLRTRGSGSAVARGYGSAHGKS
ncbi:unnamed protein product [Lampetra planeri]